MIVASGSERNWLADFRILTGQEYKSVALFRGWDFISTSIPPGITGLKAKDSENDSPGKYCDNSSDGGIFDANLCPIEAQCLLGISEIFLGSEVMLLLFRHFKLVITLSDCLFQLRIFIPCQVYFMLLMFSSK